MPRKSPKQVKHLVKTEMCRFHMLNRCTKGTSCSFAHTVNEIRAKPDLFCTSMCRVFLTTGNCDNPTCSFAHSEQELRTTDAFFKTKLCAFAGRGVCRNGESCRFAHSTEELVQAEMLGNEVSGNDEDGSPEGDETLSPTAGGGEVPSPPPPPPGPLAARHRTYDSTAQSSTSAGSGSQTGSTISRVALQAAESTSTGHSSRRSYGHATGSSGRRGGSSGNDGSGDGSQSGGSQSSGSQSGGSGSNGTGSQARQEQRRLTGSAGTGRHWNDQTSDESNANRDGGSDQSTRAETMASVPTPEGSGDSGQEKPDGHGQRSRSGTDTRRGRSASVHREYTTLMIMNVPNFLTQGALVSLFEDLTVSMRGAYDFFYCPWDPVQDKNLGYAIMNFSSRTVASAFERQWSNQTLLSRSNNQKKLRVVPAALQGRTANIRHFSGFSLARHVDPRFRPLVRANPNETLRPMALSEEITQRRQANLERGQAQLDAETSAPPALPPAGFPEASVGPNLELDVQHQLWSQQAMQQLQQIYLLQLEQHRLEELKRQLERGVHFEPHQSIIPPLPATWPIMAGLPAWLPPPTAATVGAAALTPSVLSPELILAIMAREGQTEQQQLEASAAMAAAAGTAGSGEPKLPTYLLQQAAQKYPWSINGGEGAGFGSP